MQTLQYIVKTSKQKIMNTKMIIFCCVFLLLSWTYDQPYLQFIHEKQYPITWCIFPFYMSAYADQNHAPSLAAARLEFSLLNLWTKKDKHYSAYLFSHSRMPRHSLLTINGSCGFHIHARHRYVPLHDHDHDDCTLHQDYNLTFRS